MGGLIGTNTKKSNALIRKGNFCLLGLSSNHIIEIPYSSNAFEIIERNTGSKAFICFRAYNNTAKKLECGTFGGTKFMNDKENHKFYIKNTSSDTTREYIIISLDNSVSANIVQDNNYTFEEIILS